ncbi:Fic family protein [Patescibacteria group bacterium]|nr:Fic family protein [Patescibacteria group bacterium]
MYRTNERIESALGKLESRRKAYILLSMISDKVDELRRQSMVKSALYSAKIGGNPLSIEEVVRHAITSPAKPHMQEVINVVGGLQYLKSHSAEKITTHFLLGLHTMVLEGLAASSGRFRTEDKVLVNDEGVTVYLAPKAEDVLPMVIELCQWCNLASDPAPAAAAIAHVWFEKIHPFADGNGRVGRLLISHILAQGDAGFYSIAPWEEQLAANRPAYLTALQGNQQDVTEFVEFFVTTLAAAADASLSALEDRHADTRPDLLPRRAEILGVIRDHRMVSFDFIIRRFRAVPASTLHYDLRQLVKQGYVKKLGATRGVVYEAV